MEKRILLLSMVLMCSCNVGTAAIRKDGNWWLKQTAVQRDSVVQGFLEGMILGHRFSYWEYASDSSPEGKQKRELAIVSYTNQRNKYLPGLSAAQLSDGLSQFYDDALNRHIELADAVFLFLRRSSGMPASDFEEMLANYRRAASERLRKSGDN